MKWIVERFLIGFLTFHVVYMYIHFILLFLTGQFWQACLSQQMELRTYMAMISVLRWTTSGKV